MSSSHESGRTKRLRRLLNRALELPTEERRAFLQEESISDPDLSAEVSALLQPTPEESGHTGPAATAATLGLGDESDWALHDTEEIPERWGHLELLSKLGEGAFGQVYLCRDPSLDRNVALKLFRTNEGSGRPVSREVLERIQKEGQMLARVEHPNVLRVLGVGAHDGEVGLWMEYVRGSTLAELLESQGRFGAREACLIGVELCSALAAVHARGVIHRDIKAQNVIRQEGGRIILMDFGAGRDLVKPTAQQASEMAGTPIYMAPETLEGSPSTVSSDLYALGVLLFHLVTKTYPAKATSSRKVREMHRSGEVTALRDVRSDLPARFVRVVERALDPDPQGRFGTAGQMQAALEAAADLMPEGATTAEAGDTAQSIRRTARVLTRLGMAAAIAVVVGFLGFVTTRAYTQAFSIPAEMHDDRIPDYFVSGLQALLPAIGFALYDLLGLAALWALLRGTPRLTRRLGVMQGVATRLERAQNALQSTPGSSYQAAALAVGAVCIGAIALMLVATDGTLLETVFALTRPQTWSELDTSILSNEHRFARHLYLWSLVTVLVTMLVLTNLASRRRTGKETAAGGRWGLAGTLTLAIVIGSLAIAPSQLLWANKRDEIVCRLGETRARTAFVVARGPEGDDCRNWLYFPDNHERRGVGCEELETQGCRLTGENRHVFDGASRGER